MNLDGSDVALDEEAFVGSAERVPAVIADPQTFTDSADVKPNGVAHRGSPAPRRLDAHLLLLQASAGFRLLAFAEDEQERAGDVDRAVRADDDAHDHDVGEQ